MEILNRIKKVQYTESESFCITLERKKIHKKLMYYILIYLFSVSLGYLIPQVTESKVEVSKLINLKNYIITNTQFDIDILGRLSIILVLACIYVIFIIRYKEWIDREFISIKTITILQCYIYITGILHGLQLTEQDVFKNIFNIFNMEFWIGLVMILFLSSMLVYQCKIEEKAENVEIEKPELKNLNLSNIYPSREISVKKMLYFLGSDIGSSLLVDGDWGIGKTYFVTELLKENNKFFLNYDVLLYDSRRKLMKIFLKDLKVLAKENKFLIGDSYDYLCVLEPFISKVPFGLGELFLKKIFTDELKNEFGTYLKRFENPIIVVIDNLERIDEKRIFIEVVGFLHELDDFENIKIIILMDTKKLEGFDIPSGYIDKFFINQIELKEIPIQNILTFISGLNEKIELDKIIYELEKIKGKLNEKIVKNMVNFQNPRIYERVLKRFEMHINSYDNIYKLELSEAEYKNWMFLSSALYFLLPNLEMDTLKELVTDNQETTVTKLIRRDYYDTGTDIEDLAQKIMQNDEIDIQLEKYLEKIIYCYRYFKEYEEKVPQKYLQFLEALRNKRDVAFNVFKIEEHSNSRLFDLVYESLKLEKEYGLDSENSIVMVAKNSLNYKSSRKYMDNLIILYKSEIEKIPFYVNPVGKELTLDSSYGSKKKINSKELEDVLDVYFSSINTVDMHIESILDRITDSNLKNSLKIFAEKYKVLRQR